MPKHTPGPWHRNIKPAKKYPTIFAGRNTHIAVIQSVGLSDEETESNCDLVTAAPDLLECLRGLLAARDSVTMGLEKELYAEWIPRARAAIAKVDKAAKNLATLTPEENTLWLESFADASHDGKSDEDADAIAWQVVCKAFPRLKSFDGCLP